MTTSQIISIVLVVLCAVAYGVMLYFKTRGVATEAASEFIALIEEAQGLVGKEKMEFVVMKLVELVPAPLKSIFTAERLEQIAQEVFDNMRRYALEYLENLEKKESEEKAEKTEE